MKIYDVSQSVFDCEVYPGDESPKRIPVHRMKDGALYNLTGFSMCAHNGTHVDAPFHFLESGKTIDEIPLEKFVGPCVVVSHEGEVTEKDAERMLQKAGEVHPGAERRILIKGRAVVTLEAAKVFAEASVDLIGNESMSVGPLEAPMAVHLELLKADVVLLEGLRLANVPDGIYTVNCAPLNLEGSDGAPCRAILLDNLM